MIILSNITSNKSKILNLVKFNNIPNTNFISKCYTNSANPLHVLKELRVLQKLKHYNIVTCKACSINGLTLTLYTNYFPHSKFKDIYLKMDIKDIKFYIINLFSTLQYLHKSSIIHGDIKPDNFLYNHNNKRFQLIDFEKAQDMNEIDINYIAGTRGYIAPERLLNPSMWSSSIDIWGAGVILASFMSGCYPFFNDKCNGNWKTSLIIQITMILGTAEFINFAQKMSIAIKTNIELQSKNLFDTFLELRNDADNNNVLRRNDIEMGCMFLEQILVYEPNKRMNAANALLSKFLT